MEGHRSARHDYVYVDRDGRVRGMLFWNRFGHVDAERKLIRESPGLAKLDLPSELTTPLRQNDWILKPAFLCEFRRER